MGGSIVLYIKPTGFDMTEGIKMDVNTATIITTELCEGCESSTEFSLNDLIAQDLTVTHVVNFHGNNAVNYEGEWVCRCGHDNSTIGQAEVQ